jgi:hypothetical protein
VAHLKTCKEERKMAERMSHAPGNKMRKLRKSSREEKNKHCSVTTAHKTTPMCKTRREWKTPDALSSIAGNQGLNMLQRSHLVKNNQEMK